MFPGPTYTPSCPSSTSPAPSSTPLGLDNCYSYGFCPRTSAIVTGEEDDSGGGGDGNSEYDDIYDDE